MTFTARIPEAVSTLSAVSAQDAALKAATRWASAGIIPHTEAITVSVFRDDRAAPTVVEVTPLGRTWGALETIRQWTEVAA